jgi:hypothetical protein
MSTLLAESKLLTCVTLGRGECERLASTGAHLDLNISMGVRHGMQATSERRVYGIRGRPLTLWHLTVLVTPGPGPGLCTAAPRQLTRTSQSSTTTYGLTERSMQHGPVRVGTVVRPNKLRANEASEGNGKHRMRPVTGL